MKESFNDCRGRGYDDSVPGEVTKTAPSRYDYMILYMVGKLTPNLTHFTKRLVKQVPGRGYFRDIPSRNGDKFVTFPTLPIV